MIKLGFKKSPMAKVLFKQQPAYSAKLFPVNCFVPINNVSCVKLKIVYPECT